MDFTFNPMEIHVTGAQILNWIIYFIITTLFGLTLKHQFNKYVKKREKEALLKLKKIERIALRQEAMDYGLQKCPSLNGNYTDAKDTKYAQLVADSDILKEEIN